MYQRGLSIEEICNKLRPVFGKKIDQIYFQYTVSQDRNEKEEIAGILSTLYQKHLNELLNKGVLLEPPKEKMIDGEYELATVSYARKKLFPFKLREKDWPRHICVTGMSGSGKTTFAFKIIESLNSQSKPYLIFDWKKSFRPLSAVDNSIMTFTVGDESVSNLFKMNINEPPRGVAPKEWINTLADLLTESFQASFGVHKVILETLDEAFKEWGVYHGSENYPTWNHIKWRLEEKISKINNRESGWIESALRIATVLTFGEFGKVVNYKGDNSFDVEELLDKKVVMELNSLGNIEKKFFCEYVLTYIFKLKKARQNFANQKFDHAIIVDEAHNIFLKKPTNFSNESVTDMVYREMREYGTSLVCLDQHISKISDAVKGNSACHIAFQQQLPQDIYEISGIMDMKEHQNYFTQLAVGNAIVKLAERYTSPFLIEIPNVELREQHVNNEEIKSRMQAMMLNHDYKKEVDEEFNHELENPIETKEINIIDNLKEKAEITEDPKEDEIFATNKPTSDYTEAQQMIYDFVTNHLQAGVELMQIENILEKSKSQGGYSSYDIMKVINDIFNNQLQEKKQEKIDTTEIPYEESTLEIINEMKKIDEGISDLNNDEQNFINFLKQNPTHELSTVEVYKQVGLSPRKGTVTKNLLLEKNLIKIEEIKYEKGWKKIIRAS